MRPSSVVLGGAARLGDWENSQYSVSRIVREREETSFDPVRD
jgi:hypothetical protein